MNRILASATAREKVAATVLAYYRLTKALDSTALDLAAWVDALPSPERQQAVLLGLRQQLLLPTFKRYLLEKRGHSMAVYMADHLTPEELTYWVDDGDGGVRR